MPRPIKWRKVKKIPEYRHFVPCGVDKSRLQQNILKVEEIEAIRLRDLEGLEQQECAENMEISRQTFQRIYNEAKKKVADSLINGKSIKVQGGNYTQNICTIICEECGNKWDTRVEDVNTENQCPKCGSFQYHCFKKHGNTFCYRKCDRNNMCRKEVLSKNDF